MASDNIRRSRLAWLGGIMALWLVLCGCQQEVLNKEAVHGLANDPYPVAPKNLAPILRVLIWPDTIGSEITERFQKRYGVKLEVDTFDNDDEAYDMAVRNPSKWGVIMVSQYMADRMRRNDLLAQVPRINGYIYQYLDTSVLNEKADPQMKYFIPFDYSVLGISFNIDYIAGFPRKWTYLTAHTNNPHIYGRFVMTDDMRFAMGAALLFAGVDPANATPQDITEAKDLLVHSVRELGLRFLPDAKIRTEMQTNAAIMAITWSGEAAAMLKTRAACRFLVPEGKAIVNVDGLCIPKGSSDPETSALFIEFLLHPYNSLLVANGCLYASVNQRSMKYADRFLIGGPSCMLPLPSDRIHMKYLEGEDLKICRDAWAEVKEARLDTNRINLIPLR